jgi:hypothetical protein
VVLKGYGTAVGADDDSAQYGQSAVQSFSWSIIRSSDLH